MAEGKKERGFDTLHLLSQDKKAEKFQSKYRVFCHVTVKRQSGCTYTPQVTV